MNETMLESPRWPGGPRICLVINLPAFENEDDMKKFEDKYTVNKVKSRWLCQACGCWHYFTETA